MKALALSVLLGLLFSAGENYRILGLFPLPSKSHTVMYESLMKGLAEKGHEVDVLNHFPQKTPLPRYNDIDVRDAYPSFVNNISIPFARDKMSTYYDTIKFIFIDAGSNVCRSILNSPEAKKLKETDKKYDLVITEIFGSDCMLGFAHHFKVPVIGMTSSVNLPWGADRIGNPDNPSYIPNYFVPYVSVMSLLERVVNTVVLLVAKMWASGLEDASTTIAREFFGSDLPDLRELACNTSLIFVNSHFSINHARPTVPNFIEVGGIHIRPEKTLPKHLEDSLNITSQYKGVIYLSMGSMLLTETLPPHKLSAFFEAFRELPYKVLWKANRENMPKDVDIPPNIQFEPWLPQLDILCHPNVKLFVTHGGLMGTQEGIFCGVPRLGIPLFADQELNLKTSQTMGLAIMVDYDNITKESILGGARILLEEPRYRDNAKRISKLFRDRPLSALDTAIYWVEYVIRHRGAPHLRSAGADLPWYQYFLVDVIVVILASLTAFTAVIYYAIFFTIRALFFNDKGLKKFKTN